MRISILGGGPTGLYFAILMKRTWPRLEIAVHERNRADDTFGFGVVFSDQTLETFERYDAESFRASRRPLPTGTTSRSVSAARCTASAATGSAAVRGARCCCCCTNAAARSASSCASVTCSLRSPNSPAAT